MDYILFLIDYEDDDSDVKVDERDDNKVDNDDE